MSSKTKTSSKQAQPRKLPQMEAIITRHKSAQLRRQLRDKQESIAKINQMTQLLTSPTSQKNSTNFKFQRPRQPVSTKAKASSKKVKRPLPCQAQAPKTPEKRKQRVSESEGSLEYYPNKLKRKVEAKKVMLKPKHELKVIGRTKICKRKLAVPQKGIKSPSGSKRPKHNTSTLEPKKPHSPSIEDMARLTDGSDSLNDEDWLEILTCPSPVWWEDPPDAHYSEDAICPRKSRGQKNTKLEEEKNEIIETKACLNVNDQIIVENETKMPATQQRDNKFINKRNKLENLLGSLKDKLGCDQIALSDNIKHNKTKNDNLSNRNDDKTEKINNSDRTINNIEINEKVKDEFSQNKLLDNKVAETGDDDVNNKRKGKGTSESTEGDDPFSYLRDDDLLNDLENMDIPIEPESDTDVYCIIDDSTPSTSKSFLDSGKDFNTLKPNLIKNESNVGLKKFKVNDMNYMKIGNVNSKIIKKDRNYQENNMDDKVASTLISKGRDTTNMVLYDSLDTNKINVKNFEKLKKHKKGYPKIITNVIDNPKTVNTRNIVPNENFDVVESNATKDTVNVKTNAHGNKSECMTVYKIISNDGLVSSTVLEESSFPANSTITDKEQNSIPLDAVKNRLDLFYKKFKNTHQRRLRKSEISYNNSSLHTQNEDQVETEVHDEVIKTEENATTDQNDGKVSDESSLCDSCDPKVKAIVVSNKNRVNYCLKCSCIFDTENCAYCVRQAMCDDEPVASDSGTSEKQSCESVVENNELS